MASLGPNNGNSFSSNALIGTIAVVTPSNAQTSNDTRATAILLLGEVTQWLLVKDFRLNIPIHSTIDGITVEIEKSSTLLSATQDNAVRLYLPTGTFGATNKALGGTWPTTDAYSTYGGVSDVWGETLRPIDVNDANFGVAISASAALAATMQIDHVRITVNYTPLAMPHNTQKHFRAGNGISIGARAL